MKYKFLKHTADVKFRAYGKTLNECFENSALAMFDSMYPEKIKSVKSKNIRVKGKDLESLLYNFLEKYHKMDESTREIKEEEYKNQISKTIQNSLIDLYGINGFSSIMRIVTDYSKITETEILTNFKLFERLIEKTFGDVGKSKMIEPIKSEINKTDIQNNNLGINQKQKRLLIADDEPTILKLYQSWLKFENRYVITVEDGQK